MRRHAYGIINSSLIPENHYATRKPVYDNRTFLFVGRDHFLIEETGEIKPRKECANYLLTYSGECPILCTNDSASLVKELDDILKDVPNWTWRATPLRRVKRGSGKPREAKAAVSIRLNPLYCGFKRANGHNGNRYFHFIDTVGITQRTSQHLYPELDEIQSLERFGVRYRDFCRTNNIPLANTRGAIGGAFLRDPRWFGPSERIIPTFVNETAREHLPGNHYELLAPTHETLEGLYLDISNAHHDAARRTEFPDPAGIRARGKHRSSQESTPSGEPWARANSRKGRAILSTHGMVLLQCGYRGTAKGTIVHPAARTATTNRPNYIYAYTNELNLLRSSGFSIDGIEAAWTSGRTSRSLNNYAEHAIETLQRTSPEDKQWIKPLLLSTYGMLGKRPNQYQSVSNFGGKSYTWPTSSGWIEGGVKETSKMYSPATTNVVALGMIQAETRRNVIETARYLQSVGVHVLALYADSLICATTSPGVPGPVQLPFLTPEWRVKTELTGLRFFNPVSFISDQEERLPGISRESTLRESRRSAIRARSRVTYGAHGEESRPVEPPKWLMDLNDRTENRFSTNV